MKIADLSTDSEDLTYDVVSGLVTPWNEELAGISIDPIQIATDTLGRFISESQARTRRCPDHDNTFSGDLQLGHLKVSSSENLPRRKRDSTAPKKAICPICGIQTLQKTQNKHLKTHDVQKEVFSCDFCAAMFSCKFNKDRHEREKHGEDSITQTCEYCGADVVKRWLRRHHDTAKCRAMQNHSRSSTKLALDFLVEGSDACFVLLLKVSTPLPNYDSKMRIGPRGPQPLWLHLPWPTLAEICELREYGIASVKKGLLNRYGEIDLMIMVLLLADLMMFGKSGGGVAAHDNYLQSKDCIRFTSPAAWKQDLLGSLTFITGSHLRPFENTVQSSEMVAMLIENFSVVND